MNSRIAIKNLVVALTLGLAVIATWAVTKSDAPAIEASAPLAKHA